MRPIIVTFAGYVVLMTGSALAATRTYVCTQTDGMADISHIDGQSHTVTSETDGPVPVISYQGSSTITFTWSDASNTLDLRTGRIIHQGEAIWAGPCSIKK
jgi:hypothetical protein